MGMRRMGSAQRARQRAKAHARNRPRKVKERARRDARMLETIRGTSAPYAPWVLSWLSAKLDKPSRSITQGEIDGLVGREAQAVAS